jgi:hypothetical protein
MLAFYLGRKIGVDLPVAQAMAAAALASRRRIDHQAFARKMLLTIACREI